MMFHASMPAQSPEHVAKVIAELWRGVSFPFPPFPDAFIALAADERGTEIEVVPATQENVIGESEVGTRTNAAATGASACHFAIATPLTEGEVFAIAKREGWHAARCDRGGCFHVIEFWVENRFLLEVLTRDMQAEYLAFMKPAVYAKTFGFPQAA
jgi:hypothetical protein